MLHIDNLIAPAFGSTYRAVPHSCVLMSVVFMLMLMFLSQVRLDTMVTVVDAGAFLAAYTTGDKMTQRPDLGVGGKSKQRWLLDGFVDGLLVFACVKRGEIDHTGSLSCAVKRHVPEK